MRRSTASSRSCSSRWARQSTPRTSSRSSVEIAWRSGATNQKRNSLLRSGRRIIGLEGLDISAEDVVVLDMKRFAVRFKSSYEFGILPGSGFEVLPRQQCVIAGSDAVDGE